MIKIAICEDNIVHRQNLIALINKVKQPERAFQIYEYESGEHLITEAGENHDIVFLDVELQGTMNGFQAAEFLRERNDHAIFVFCTGTQGGLPAKYVQVQARSYILKDDPEDQQLAEIRRIFEDLYRVPERMAFLSKHGRVHVVNLDEVVYFARLDRHVWIRRVGDDMTIQRMAFLSREEREEHFIWTREKVSSIYERVRDYWFEHSTDGYIVNLKYVQNATSKHVIMKDNERLSLSKVNSPVLKERLIFYTNHSHAKKEPRSRRNKKEESTV